MNSRTVALVGIVAMGFLGAAIESFHYEQYQPTPPFLHFGWQIVFVAFIFWWVVIDSRERQYHRSMMLNVAIVGLSVVSVPYYLFRSRESGQRAKTFLRLLVFCVAVFVAAIAGSVAGAAII